MNPLGQTRPKLHVSGSAWRVPQMVPNQKNWGYLPRWRHSGHFHVCVYHLMTKPKDQIVPNIQELGGCRNGFGARKKGSYPSGGTSGFSCMCVFRCYIQE